jgi:hypothetical protein
MSSLSIGSLILLTTFGSTLWGLRLQKRIPQEILGVDMRDVLKALIGVLGTLSALLLSLMIKWTGLAPDHITRPLVTRPVRRPAGWRRPQAGPSRRAVGAWRREGGDRLIGSFVGGATICEVELGHLPCRDNTSHVLPLRHSGELLQFSEISMQS